MMATTAPSQATAPDDGGPLQTTNDLLPSSDMSVLSTVIDEVALARERGVKPRVHPNGFLQLDLEPDRLTGGQIIAKRRLHIFDEELPRQSVRTSIHDHVFDMSSFVVSGMILNDTYRIVPDEQGEYEVYQAQAGRGNETTLQRTEKRVRREIVRTDYVRAGDRYNFPALEFHDSRHEGRTMTIMTKLETIPLATPRVLVPVGSEPDNSFSREDQDIDALWTFVAETVGRLILA